MRFNNIQVLRIFAAVGVVVFHLGCHGPALIGIGSPRLKFPLFAGFPVPLFFAVSGFVLTQAIQTASPGRFLLARFLRLYPGYWLALAGMLLLMRLRVFTEHHRWMSYFTNWTTVTLWPAGEGRVLYFLSVEWSLVYEVFLSVSVAALSLGRRRSIPVLAFLWLSAIVLKIVVWPEAFSEQFPRWSTIGLSALNAPFLLGVISFALRKADIRWAMLVAPIVLTSLALGSTVLMSLEQVWLCWGVAGAGAVWLAVKLPQLADRNVLVRLGDCTYGLFLFHAPLLFAVLYPASRLGGYGRVEVLWLAAAVAIVGGLLFGRMEAALHSRLRPIAKKPLPHLSAKRFIRLMQRAKS